MKYSVYQPDELDSTVVESVPEISVKNQTVLVISDLHIPYEFVELVDLLKEEYAGSVLVINGDIIDAYNLSKFPKVNVHTFVDELIHASRLVGELSEVFEKVILLPGNHERRLFNLARNNVVADIMPLIRNPVFYMQHHLVFNEDTDTLEAVRKYPNVDAYDTRFFRIGNVLFMHPSNYRSAPGSTVRGAIETAIGLNLNFDIMVIGHTHQVQQISYLGKIGIESGCITKHTKYIQKKARFSRRPDVGYVVLQYDENGKCEVPIALNATHSSLVRVGGML